MTTAADSITGRKNEKANILIIEDEVGPREALKIILQAKYNIFTSRNGTDAVHLLDQEDIDLITIDINLPGTPGHQLLTDLRRMSPDSEMMIISGTGTLESAIEGIRNGVGDFITKPFRVVEILSSVQRLLEKKSQRNRYAHFFQNMEKVSRSVSSEFESSMPFLSPPPSLNLLDFARVLCSTLDGQDRYTHGHCERVARYSVMVAEEFGFSKEECEELMIAGYLHDIGKIGIDRQIIRKQGPLTPSEKNILRSHPQRGLRIISPLSLSPLSHAVIRSHHECWDGTGYPDGLIGDQIHLAARIVRVADVYDAMTSTRPYRSAIPKEQVLTELRNCALSKFDPEVVEIFTRKIQH
jgi:response regulator RpfG family c-di-GMP phosphodiesterase